MKYMDMMDKKKNMIPRCKLSKNFKRKSATETYGESIKIIDRFLEKGCPDRCGYWHTCIQCLDYKSCPIYLTKASKNSTI